jgi:hypothetical protein
MRPTDGEGRCVITEGPTATALVDGVLDAAVSYDPTRLRSRLDLAVESLGVGGCLDEVLFPALRSVGRSWQSGSLDVEAERLATETARGWLERLLLQAPQPTDAPPLILTCGPADLHSIGLEALGVLLRHRRQRCRVLGARTSVDALTTAIRANRPEAVVVVSHLRRNRPTAAQALRAAAALGPDVFYAGAAFGTVRLRRNVPGTHLDTDLRGASEILLRTSRGATGS